MIREVCGGVDVRLIESVVSANHDTSVYPALAFPVQARNGGLIMATFRATRSVATWVAGG